MWGSGDTAAHILNLSYRRRLVISFIPGKIAPGTHWIGSWVGLRADLDAVVKRKITILCWSSNPDHPARSPYRYSADSNSAFSIEHEQLIRWWYSSFEELRQNEGKKEGLFLFNDWYCRPLVECFQSLGKPFLWNLKLTGCRRVMV